MLTHREAAAATTSVRLKLGNENSDSFDDSRLDPLRGGPGPLVQHLTSGRIRGFHHLEVRLVLPVAVPRHFGERQLGLRFSASTTEVQPHFSREGEVKNVALFAADLWQCDAW